MGIFDIRAFASIDGSQFAAEEGDYHFCLLDIGCWPEKSERVALIRHLRKIMPVLIMSETCCNEAASLYTHTGAVWVFNKPLDMESSSNCGIIRTMLMERLFGLYGHFELKSFRSIFEMLRIHLPHSADEWARLLGIEDRRLRRFCACCGLSAYHALKMFHMWDKMLLRWQFNCEHSCRGYLSDAILDDFYMAHNSNIKAFLCNAAKRKLYSGHYWSGFPDSDEVFH
jgi:hypothetical protein